MRSATKAAENVFYIARINAAKFNDRFSSREGAAEELGIDRTRLARIELGVLDPYSDEVVLMASAYKEPHLRMQYCKHMCPLGKNFPEVEEVSLDRISLEALSKFRKINTAKELLLDITADGVIDDSEKDDLRSVIETLDAVAKTAEQLKCWAEKNLDSFDLGKERS